MAIQGLSAITLATRDVERSLAFYELLGFERAWANDDESFVVLRGGESWLNLFRAGQGRPWAGWGRFIVHVEAKDEVDAVHDRLIAAGHPPEMAPSNAPWGERYFHVRDPDEHEVSIAFRFRPVGGREPE